MFANRISSSTSCSVWLPETSPQPPELTAEALTERIDLPLLWTAQEQAVGIA
jgi:hypothetical protein